MKLKWFSKLLALSLALGGTAGCGEALMDGEYPGEARYVVQGEVRSLAPATQVGKTHVMLAWDNFARNGDITLLQSVKLTSKNPPFDYQLRIFEDPEPSALNDFRSGFIGFGNVLVYEDQDGNGVSDWRAPVRGEARNHVVIFVPEVTEALKSTLREWGIIVNVDDLKQGFNLARGVCSTPRSLFDNLQIIPDEPVTVSDPNDSSQPSCINYH
jgi:hypothetical protein